MNNWNDERKTRKSEQVVLGSLLENRDFESYLYLYIVAASNMDLNYYTPLGTRMDSVADLIRAAMEN